VFETKYDQLYSKHDLCVVVASFGWQGHFKVISSVQPDLGIGGFLNIAVALVVCYETKAVKPALPILELDVRGALLKPDDTVLPYIIPKV